MAWGVQVSSGDIPGVPLPRPRRPPQPGATLGPWAEFLYSMGCSVWILDQPPHTFVVSVSHQLLFPPWLRVGSELLARVWDILVPVHRRDKSLLHAHCFLIATFGRVSQSLTSGGGVGSRKPARRAGVWSTSPSLGHKLRNLGFFSISGLCIFSFWLRSSAKYLWIVYIWHLIFPCVWSRKQCADVLPKPRCPEISTHSP